MAGVLWAEILALKYRFSIPSRVSWEALGSWYQIIWIQLTFVISNFTIPMIFCPESRCNWHCRKYWKSIAMFHTTVVSLSGINFKCSLFHYDILFIFMIVWLSGLNFCYHIVEKKPRHKSTGVLLIRFFALPGTPLLTKISYTTIGIRA